MYQGQKQKLEKKINKLEEEMNGNSKVPLFIPKNGMEAQSIYLEALRNPFYRQQMLMNQHMMGLLGKNGSSLPMGLENGKFQKEVAEGKTKKKRKGPESNGKPSKKEQELLLELEIQVASFHLTQIVIF